MSPSSRCCCQSPHDPPLFECLRRSKVLCSMGAMLVTLYFFMAKSCSRCEPPSQERILVLSVTCIFHICFCFASFRGVLETYQGACVVLSGRTDRSFITHRGSVAQFCREDIDVPRLLASSHIHVGTSVKGKTGHAAHGDRFRAGEGLASVLFVL